jgi:hypothetical protein
MLRVAFLLATFAMSTMSFPQDEEIVPETAVTLSLLSQRHPELKDATPKDAAHAKLKMLQAQGFDGTECNQLATDAISGMDTTLKAEQNAMNALSTGADCLVNIPATRRLLGIASEQQKLDAAAQALQASKADLATKEGALQDAKEAPVTLTINLDKIGADLAAIGEIVVEDEAVAVAQQAVKDAQTARDAANLVVVADQATHDTTLADAQDASQQCLCNAKTAHGAFWTRAQKVVADNTQAWKEAHHVKCALDGTADDECSVPEFNVDDKPLIAEAAGVTCSTADVVKVVYTEGTTPQGDNTGTIDVTPHQKYAIKFEILRNDLGDASEYVTDVLVDGASLGSCHPDGGDHDCTFFTCSFSDAEITPTTNSIDVNVKLTGHSWDCDCDTASWECSKENTVSGRTPVTAVGRFTLTPLQFHAL